MGGFDNDENAFERIAAVYSYAHMGSLPSVSPYWSPAMVSPGSCDWIWDPEKGKMCPPGFDPPESPIGPPEKKMEFPNNPPKSNWEEAVWATIGGLIDVGEAKTYLDGLELIRAFVEFLFVNLGWAEEWSEHDEKAGGYSVKLNFKDARRLHYRWAAVRLHSELANWYPWSLLDFGQAGIDNSTKWKVFPNSGPTGWRPDAAIYYSEAILTDAELWVQRPWTNPLEASLFSLSLLGDSIIPNSGPLAALMAVNLLTEWFHGPSNAYDACLVIECEHKWCKVTYGPEGEKIISGICKDLTNPLNIQLYDFVQNPPFPLKQCQIDGHQAWIHLPETFVSYYPWFVGQLEKLGVVPYTFRMLSQWKMGGCLTAAEFFVGAISAANVPAEMPLNSLAGTVSAKLGLTAQVHAAVFLPVFDLALLHGDDLWGPGGALFPSSELWLPGQLAFGHMDYAEKLPPELHWGSSHYYANWDDLSLQHKEQKISEAQFAAGATFLLFGLYNRYLAGRSYLISMLKAAYFSPYTKVVRDAIIFKASKFGESGSGLAFGAIREWATVMDNPAYVPPEDVKDEHYLQPLRNIADMSQLPTGLDTTIGSAWEEPELQKWVGQIFSDPEFELGAFDKAT